MEKESNTHQQYRSVEFVVHLHSNANMTSSHLLSTYKEFRYTSNGPNMKKLINQRYKAMTQDENNL